MFAGLKRSLDIGIYKQNYRELLCIPCYHMIFRNKLLEALLGCGVERAMERAMESSELLWSEPTPNQTYTKYHRTTDSGYSRNQAQELTKF